MTREDLERQRNIWERVWRAKTGFSQEDSQAAFDRELELFNAQIRASQDLQGCTEESIKNTFLEIATCGLSIASGSKQEAFLGTRNTKARGPRGEEVWIRNMTLNITAYGELNMRIMAGQIVRANNPVVIYDCDYFQPRTNEHGDLIVEYRPQLPRPQGARIIGCWIQLVLPRGGRDYKWLMMDDVARLYAASERQNRGKANALYTSNGGQIDTGFLEAKTIKHAMRAYTKLRASNSVVFEDDEIEENQESQTFDDPQEKADDSVNFDMDENVAF